MEYEQTREIDLGSREENDPEKWDGSRKSNSSSESRKSDQKPEQGPDLFESVNHTVQLEQLLKDLRACRHCQEQFGFEPRPVQWGYPTAKIMHISQAPSKKVHEIGRPFSDLSGKRLRQKWYQISDEQFYDKNNFYITTVGHCFPGKSGRGNYDKKPPKCCYEMWTRREIELMDSCELYLIVGGEAASRIFPGQKLTDLVFQDHQLNGKLCYVLPHPSPLNMNWFRDHPEFEEKRMPEIRQKIHAILNLPLQESDAIEAL